MPVVDVSFRISGSVIPADHGYDLYVAVSRLVPELERGRETPGSPWKALGIHPIYGRNTRHRLLGIDRYSWLTLRIDSQLVPFLLPLQGKTLALGRHKVTLGTPSTLPLEPSPELRSRLTVIRGQTTIETFLPAARTELDSIGVRGYLAPIRRIHGAPFEGRRGYDADPFIRRTLMTRDGNAVGYALSVQDLDPDESTRLQELGIGGLRRYGCGIFAPAR